jgi:metallo-beta-lactamase class B
MYGSKLAISRIDAEMVRQRAEKGNIGGALHPLAKAPQFDLEIEDGNVIEMGNVKIRCVLTPGHTKGVLSLFFDVTYEGKAYTAGLFGGAGTNALKLTYICKYDSPEDCPQHMLNSIAKLRNEKVDIHLGNHPGNNNTLGKRQKQLKEGGNPFINEKSWGDFLDSLEERVHEIIAENNELNQQLDELFDGEQI